MSLKCPLSHKHTCVFYLLLQKEIRELLLCLGFFKSLSHDFVGEEVTKEGGRGGNEIISVCMPQFSSVSQENKSAALSELSSMKNCSYCNSLTGLMANFLKILLTFTETLLCEMHYAR